MRAKTIGIVATTILLIAPLSQAATAAPPTATEPRSESPSTAPAPTSQATAAAAARAGTSSCDAVAKRQQRSPEAKATIMCLEPLAPGDTPPQESGEAMVAFQPMPEYCGQYPAGTWWFYRTQACMMQNWQLNVEMWINGQRTIVGYIRFWELSYSYTAYDIPTWAQQMQIQIYQAVGDVVGLTIQGSARCTGACRMGNVFFPPQPAMTGQPGGEAFFHSSGFLPGFFGYADTEVSWYFTKPGAIPSITLTANPPGVRCDNQTPGIDAGCVFYGYIPVMIYDRAGQFPELARHIGDAQASGLPGGYPAGPPLHRLVDEVLQSDNRDVACPDSYPRPPLKSCDEYPFASTWQGAYTGGGLPRTFSWCGVTPPAPHSTGAGGYSVCMIDDWQNSVGGSALGTFYRENRVLHWDPFLVWIR